jgi:hypothetical protein
MTQGATRVKEYEHHFMKMMRYAPENTNLKQKKQFWFLRGLHRSLRQGLKAGEHNSLRHLMIRAITLEDDRRGREDHVKDMKGMGDRDHFDRSFQKSRDGSSNMKRGNFRSGTNQQGSNFGGGNNYYSKRGELQLPVAEWRIQPSIAEHSETQHRRVYPNLLRSWQAWAQILPVPRQEDHSYAHKSTDSRRRTSSVYSSAISKPWKVYPYKEGKATNAFATAIGEI